MYWAAQEMNLCAISFGELNLPIGPDEAIRILEAPPLNFERVRCTFPDMLVTYARNLVGTPRYRRGTDARDAPAVVDCSSFVRWIYGLHGIGLHRRSILQRDCDGGRPVELDDVRAGDLVFMAGYGHNYWWPGRPDDDVGHVMLATGEGTVVHANRRGARHGVTEDSIARALTPDRFRGARRWVEDPDDFYVIRTTPRWCVRSSNDLLFLILQNMRC
ncbi:C40 family peptidase [Patescibacteria group bacterium]